MLLHMGFDLGKDRATSSFAAFVKADVLAKTGVRILDNVHGLMVYEDDLPMSIPVTSAQGRAMMSPTTIFEEWRRQYERNHQLTDTEVLAFELYSAAQREPFPRARFLTLVSIVEVLARPRPRTADALALVDSFLQQAGSVPGLAHDERQALTDSLRVLKKQSIRSVCRSHVEAALGTEEWREFDRLYAIRSTLTHDGRVDADLNVEGTTLEGIVSRLLARVGEPVRQRTLPPSPAAS